MITKIKRRSNGAKNGMPMGGRLIYAKPSFLEGVARIFDFGGTLDTYYYLDDEDPRKTDASRSWTMGRNVPKTANWYIRYAEPNDSSTSDLEKSA